MKIKYSQSFHLIPLVTCASFFFLPVVHANEQLDSSSDQDNVQKLKAITLTASRADEVQEKSKQVTKL
ncbi:MAG: hypothetical protein RR479_13035, partial [Acinetobacter sp.]